MNFPYGFDMFLAEFIRFLKLHTSYYPIPLFTALIILRKITASLYKTKRYCYNPPFLTSINFLNDYNMLFDRVIKTIAPLNPKSLNRKYGVYNLSVL